MHIKHHVWSEEVVTAHFKIFIRFQSDKKSSVTLEILLFPNNNIIRTLAFGPIVFESPTANVVANEYE